MSPDNQNSTSSPTPQVAATPQAQQPAKSVQTPLQDTAATPQAQQPAKSVQTPPQDTAATPKTPASVPSAQTPATQAPTSSAAATTSTASCKCPVVNPANWDKKKTTINKTFFKAFSPRLFYYPFSFVIDVLRATKGAQAKNYQVVENGMVIDDGAMFLGNVMIEVTGANANDPQVLSLAGKEVYTKVSRNDWKNIKLDIAELEKELGKKPAQLLIWWTSCPTCTANKEAKAVLIALP